MRTMLSTLRCLVVGSAILVLSACSQTADVMETPAPTPSDQDQMVDPARQAALQASLEEAQASLEEVRKRLAEVRATGEPTAIRSMAEERQQALTDAVEAVENLGTLLEAQPETPARRAATAALESVGSALTATQAALTSLTATQAALTSLTAAQAGLAGVDAAAVDAEALRALENMETKVNEALAAVAAARTALEANPDPDVSAVLARAQVTLGTAQASLVPVLRQELAMLPPLALTEAQAAWTQAQAGTEEKRKDLVASQRALVQVETDVRVIILSAESSADDRTTARTTADTQRKEAEKALEAAADDFLTARQAERTAAAAYLRAAQAALEAARAALEAATTDEQRRVATEQRRVATEAVAAAEAAEYALRAWTAIPAADPTADGRFASPFAPPPTTLSGAVPIPAAVASDNARWPESDFTVRFKVSALANIPGAGPDDEQPIPHADGKTVISPAATGGNADEFPIRTLMLRADLRESYEGAAHDSNSRTPKTPVVHSPTAIGGRSIIIPPHYQSSKYQARMESTIRLTADGVVMKAGGTGAEFADFGAFSKRNLEIIFDAPFADPADEPNYYWASRFGLRSTYTDAQGEERPFERQPEEWRGGGGMNELSRLYNHGTAGDYRFWLSNHAGRDDDDEHRYLSYAAYGLFVYHDYLTEYPRPARMQALHFGYDAFTGLGDGRVNNENPSIEATFKGRTMGMILHSRTISVGSEQQPGVGHFTRLRGDVTLNACIGGGGCTGDGIPTSQGSIKGSITNLEVLQNGIWQEYPYLRDVPAGASPESVTLMEGGIAANGQYSGEARALNHPSEWNSGEYKGALYGPKDAMETAGWWRLEPDTAAQNYHVGAFGSFGACRTAAQGGCGAPSN